MADAFDDTGGRRGRRHFAYSARINKIEEYRKGSKWLMEISGVAESIEVATNVSSRLRGMLFRDPDDITRILVPCHDIHTFGMKYPLDVAFISKDGSVLEVHRNVEGRRRIRRKEASMVAERFSRKGDWLKAGDVIRLGVPVGREENV